MKKTVNGYKPTHYDKRLDIFDSIDSREKAYFRWKENSKRTHDATTEETKLRQQTYEEQKQNSALIVAENEAKIKATYTDDLVDKIVASFEEIGIEKTLDKEEIKDLFADLLESSNLVQENEKLNKRKLPLFDEFLVRIATKHPDFIVYLPAKCFTHSLSVKLRLGKLSSEQIEILEKRLAKTDVFDNEMFKKLFIKFFPTHIAEMNVEQATYALSVCPEAFKLLKENSSLRASFKQFPQILVSVLRNSPKVLKYLSQEEIQLIPKDSISVVGYAIRSYPEVLENVPASFFRKNNPKYVFQSIKHAIKDIILSYYDFDYINKNFPELASYFTAKSIVANPSKSNGSKRRIENQGISPEINSNEVDF